MYRSGWLQRFCRPKAIGLFGVLGVFTTLVARPVFAASLISTQVSADKPSALGTRYMDIMVAPDGTLYSMYALGSTAKLYRYDNATRSWQLESSTTGSTIMSSAVDSQGRIHVAYSTNANSAYEVRYTSYDPATSTWTPSEIAYSAYSYPARYVDLALDSNDLPVIGHAYEIGPGASMYRYARADAGGSWTDNVVSITNAPPQIELAFDSANGLHVAYNFNNSNATIELRHRLPDGTTETVETASSNFNLYDLQLDATGTPTLLYERPSSTLYTRTRGASGWSNPASAVPGTSNPEFGALAFDALGQPHVAAANLLGGSDAGAFYTAHSGSGWSTLEQLSTTRTDDVAITTAGNDLYILYSIASGPQAGVWVASNVDLRQTVVPEPADLGLLGLGCAALLLGLRRRR